MLCPSLSVASLSCICLAFAVILFYPIPPSFSTIFLISSVILTPSSSLSLVRCSVQIHPARGDIFSSGLFFKSPCQAVSSSPLRSFLTRASTSLLSFLFVPSFRPSCTVQVSGYHFSLKPLFLIDSHTFLLKLQRTSS